LKTSIAFVYWLTCWLVLLIDGASAKAVNIAVDTTADNAIAGDGSCTLREAINNANRNRDTTNGDCLAGYPLPIIDAIAFNLPSGQHSIVPHSALPTITEAVVIDGTTQSGFTNGKTHSLICPNPTGTVPPPQKITISRPAIELNGSLASNVSGITINADGVVIRGLAINRFQRYGIEILNSSSRNVIDGNYIGTDISGTKALGNSRGIVIAAGGATNPNDNVIQNNVISGNTFLGILINGDERADRRGNSIIGNLIGTDYTGKQLLGNTQGKSGHGVVIGQGSFTNITERYFAENHEVRGNAIAGSHTTNLWLSNYASNNAIECNYIGTDITGTIALGNCVDGLLVGGTRSNALARLNAVRYNLISGNARCRGNTEANLTLQWGATENTVENNLIGTDITGKRALSKVLSSDGIGIKQPANLIRNNVIGGHRRHGIHLYRGFGRQPWYNLIENNYIGINPKGTNISNGGDGIAVFSNIYTPSRALPLINVRIARTRIIGNAIAYNGYNGIRLEARGDEADFQASLTDTQILQNTIRDNGANGILFVAAQTVTGAIATIKDNRMRANRISANGGKAIAFSHSLPTSHDVLIDGNQGHFLPANLSPFNKAPSTGKR
jgi:CSLREA domain-containing protein